ncbi:4-hydroxy-tetrahydrodipicolinate synthase [Periweissella cryptocerci]|uniref:4-hydroxy-tetrahydrodipicolinate synthase n=1 Tax=Periweissella cryptocerci TaxID=2506420 RepID=A0A4P6YW46_9LACO|nr:4-hydroxy-tetrahydrodipicolinate synthase [Periweissella cryptocerci]QBO37054.1 4-hydroxy-tetrahydrodipicolinate synthase [Periweissella cryptocerci]
MKISDAKIMTAIVTPFDVHGELDLNALANLTEHLLAHGSEGFVIGGTTGEAPTLSHDEKLRLYRAFAEIIDGRVPVIAGIGSYNTAETIAFGQEVAAIAGIDMGLVVVPYYNKPNQRGMVAHFTAIADAVALPIMMYNIPGRTGVTMANETVVTLAKHPNIHAVKQCTSIDDLGYLVEHTPTGFAVYTGEDAQALAAKTIGATGLVSVASHIYGDEIAAMYTAVDAGDFAHAAELQRFLTPRMNALFMYPSPSPVKALLNEQGLETGSPRLPILPLDAEEFVMLKSVLAGGAK